MTKLGVAVSTWLPDSSRLLFTIQLSAVLLLALVAGATFGIWRGYNPAAYSPRAFLEVHQGAVLGLNTLLPVLGLVANLLTLLLVVRFYGSKGFPLYAAALALMVAAGLLTRFGNQPLNAIVMKWTPDTMPANWAAIRDSWWSWHIMRTGASIASLACLIAAVLMNRSAVSPS